MSFCSLPALPNVYRIYNTRVDNLQLAERDITDETVLAPAPLTAKLVRPLMAHVAVMLAGWGLTVALVIFITNDNNLSNFVFETIKKSDDIHISKILQG